jgi:hypothetical protein
MPLELRTIISELTDINQLTEHYSDILSDDNLELIALLGYASFRVNTTGFIPDFEDIGAYYLFSGTKNDTITYLTGLKTYNGDARGEIVMMEKSEQYSADIVNLRKTFLLSRLKQLETDYLNWRKNVNS